VNLATIDSVARFKSELAKLPQYEPESEHHFHGGMYCRSVWRDAGVALVGKVHKKEHFYLVVTGRLMVKADGQEAIEVGPGTLMLSKPGTQRAVFSLEPSLCMTFHRTDAKTEEEAEAELIEEDPDCLYDCFNRVKPGVLKHEMKELL
jgi:uncharacterized cupin superfamily protein